MRSSVVAPNWMRCAGSSRRRVKARRPSSAEARPNEIANVVVPKFGL